MLKTSSGGSLPRFQEIWVELDDGRSMCALINGEKGMLIYLRNAEGDPGFSSRNPNYAGPADAKLEYILNNGQQDEYPLSWAIPFSEIERALAYFKEHKERPLFIAWNDNSLQK